MYYNWPRPYTSFFPISIILSHHKEQTINEYEKLYVHTKQKLQTRKKEQTTCSSNHLGKDRACLGTIFFPNLILYFNSIAVLLADCTLFLNNGLSLRWLFRISGFPLLHCSQQIQVMNCNNLDLASDSSKCNIDKNKILLLCRPPKKKKKNFFQQWLLKLTLFRSRHRESKLILLGGISIVDSWLFLDAGDSGCKDLL